MKYQSILTVTALAITAIGLRDQHGTLPLTLEDDSVVPAKMSQILAHDPQVGDYYVTPEDGEAWIMSPGDFEAKFASTGEAPKKKPTTKKKGK